MSMEKSMFDVYVENDDGHKYCIKTVEAQDARHAIAIVSCYFECNDDYMSAIPAFAVSKSASVDNYGDAYGFGSLLPHPRGRVPCSELLGRFYDDDKVPNGYAFALVKHPKFGHIAVTPAEFRVLGLPEVEGWAWLDAQ